MVEAIKQSLIQSGLYNELNALRGQVIDKFKNLLLQLRRVQLNRGADLTLLIKVSMSLSHINSMRSAVRLHRATSLNWLIPVLGEWPIEVFRRKAIISTLERKRREKNEWKVSLRVNLSQDKHLI